jgi:hypothetical protein
MESQFSAGPWQQQPDNPLVIRDQRGLGIAVLITDSITEQQAIANGQLMATAPDLLIACQKSETAFREIMPDVARVHEREPHKDSCFFCQLRLAIRKAGGAA